MTRRSAIIVGLCFAALFGLSFWQNLARTPSAPDSHGQAMLNMPNALAAAQPIPQEGMIDVRSYGAVGDGRTDDTAAIQAAILAARRAGRVFLPKGQFRVTSPIQISYGQNEINIVGVGEGSAIVPDLNPNTDACFVLGSDAGGVYNLHFADFAIVARANSCRYGIKQILGAGCTFDRLNLCCGASEYAYYGEGVISNTFNQCTVAGYQGGYPYARPAGGWYLKKHASGSQPNLNHWVFCSTQLQTTYGIHLEDAEGGSISGQLEFAGIADVYLKNCSFIDLGDSYSEGGAWTQILESCHHINTHDYYGNGGNLNLTGNFSSWITNSWFWGLRIDPNSYANAVGPGVWVKTFPDFQTPGSQGLLDSGRGTIYYPPLFYTPTGNADPRTNVYAAPYAPSEFRNWLANSDFSRWNGAVPDSWEAGWHIIAAQCGTGLADTTRHIAPWCAKVYNWTSGNDNGIAYTITGKDSLAPFLGRMLSFSAWIRAADANAVVHTPCLYTLLTCPSSGDFESAVSSQMAGEKQVGIWTRHYTSFYVPPDCTRIALKTRAYAAAGGKTTYYLAEPFLTVGLYGQSAWIPSYGEFNDRLTVNGYSMEWGSVPPTTGYHKQGAICWNAGAAAGGKAGWICITAGTPGTWKAFGVIDR
jgi:hypothetical protein